MMIEAIVLAGGKGTRLGDIAKNTPKPMLDVSGRPFLEYVLDYLAAQKIRRVILSVGHMADVVVSHFGESYNGLSIVYAHESSPMGTGGAIRLSMDKASSERALVLNGDTLFNPDVSALIDAHESARACITMALRHSDDIARYGSVRLEGNRILQFGEKTLSGAGLMNAGIYVVEKNYVLNAIPQTACSFEKDTLPGAVASGCLAGCVCDGYFIDIGVPDDYARAKRELASVV